MPARILWKNGLVGGEVTVNPSEYNHAIKVFSKFAYYYTASNFSGDVFLKVCKADLRLLTERDHLDLVESMIRDGMSSVYAKKFWKANNIAGYEENKESSYVLNKDANDFYGAIMQHYSLPFKDFSWADDCVDLPKIMLREKDSEWGYIAEMDLEFLEEVHDYFNDYPPAP